MTKIFFNNVLDEKLGDKSFVSARGKEVKPLKCPHCDKTSFSSPGLKGHITKMHSKAKQIIENMEVINHSMEN